MPRAVTLDNRLPFNSPDMGQPTNRRMMTRSAAKALRENSNRDLSESRSTSLLKKLDNAASNTTTKSTSNKQGKTCKSRVQVLTPPRKKVLFTEDTKGGDKENETTSMSESLRRTRIGTPFRSSKDNSDEDMDLQEVRTKLVVEEEEPLEDNAYYAVPSITVEPVVDSKISIKDEKVDTPSTEAAASNESADASSSSSTFGWSVWVLHIAVLAFAAYSLLGEHLQQSAVDGSQAIETSDDPILSMDP